MAISSEALRQRLLASLVNRPTPNTVGGALGDLGGSIATALQLRRDVPNLQATETADKIGEEVRLRDALAASGIDPGVAGSIASAPAALRGALLGLQPKPLGPVQEAQLENVKSQTAERKRVAKREDRQFQAGQGLAKRVLGGEFGELSQEQRLDAISASITGDASQLSGILQDSGREFEVIGNKDQGLHRFDPSTGAITEIVPAISGGMDKEKRARLTATLRKEAAAIPAVKAYRKALPPVKSALKSANIDSPAADLDIVFAVMKAVDPESVVRESEQAVAFAAGSPAEQFFGFWNKVTGGGRLTLQQRQELLQVAAGRMTAFRESAVSDLRQFQGIADEADVTASLAIPDLEPLPELGGVVVGPGEAGGALPERPGGGQVMRFDAQGNLVQ